MATSELGFSFLVCVLREIGFQCVILGEYIEVAWAVGVRALQGSFKNSLANEPTTNRGPYHPCHKYHFPSVEVAYHRSKRSDTECCPGWKDRSLN